MMRECSTHGRWKIRRWKMRRRRMRRRMRRKDEFCGWTRRGKNSLRSGGERVVGGGGGGGVCSWSVSCSCAGGAVACC